MSNVDWRKHLPVHPAAELFPLMSEAELKELAADIEKNGLKEKVKLVEDGNGNYSVLDGRNRLDALALNGRTDLFDSQGRPNDAVFYRKDLGDPVAYVISRNIRRRHLTAEDKPGVIVALLKLQPEKSDRQIAAMVHASRSRTVAPIRKELERTGDVVPVSHVIDTKGREQPVKKRKPKPPSTLSPETARHDRLLDLDRVEAVLEAYQQLTPPEKREFERRLRQPDDMTVGF